MARKTFISYKYSESQSLRNDILKAMGDDATYYNGETSESPDLTDTSTENIKNNLKNMMYGTSVTIIVISPNIKESAWIDWEIEYTLKEMKRGDRASRSNGIVGVIMEVNGGYDWLYKNNKFEDGCTSRTVDTSLLYEIINKNRFNLEPMVYTCNECKTVNILDGSYVSLIREKDFLDDPAKYIENAYEKSKNISSFKICKKI